MKELDFSVPVLSKLEKRNIYNKKYRDSHAQLIKCQCGGKCKEVSLYTHRKSQKHLKYLVETYGSINTNPGWSFSVLRGAFVGDIPNSKNSGGEASY